MCTVTAVECRTKIIHLFPDKEHVPLRQLSVVQRQRTFFLTENVCFYSMLNFLQRSFTISLTRNVNSYDESSVPERSLTPTGFFFYFFLRRICTARLWQLSLAQRSLTLSPSRNVYGCQSNGLPRAVLRAD